MQQTDEELDRTILAAASARWQKVAMVIARSLDRLGVDITDASAERMGSRIEALVRTGRLEAVGSLSRWRHSEIRLVPGSDGSAGDRA